MINLKPIPLNLDLRGKYYSVACMLQDRMFESKILG